MKTGWVETTIGEVCVLRSGTTLPKGIEKTSGEIPYLKVADMNIDDNLNGITSSSRYVNKSEVNASNLFPVGTTIFPKRGGAILTNKKRLTECIICADLNIMGVIPKTDLLPKLLFYYFLRLDLRKINNGSSIPQINNYTIEPLSIVFPKSLSEQQRIVGILDEAFAGIATAKANAEKNRQNARALFESHLQAVFKQGGEGWAVKRVGEIAKKSLGKMLDKAKNKGEFQPYLRNINVRWFAFDLSDLSQMRFLEEETEKFTAVKGDVLICEGGYPGRAAIWDEDYPIHFQKAIHRVRFFEREHNKWFVYFLYVKDMSGELRGHFTGTGIQHFTGETLGRFELPIPPLPQLRKLIVQFDELSEETQRLESIYQQKVAALDELKQSLLHQAFSGEL
jgi:type I restriction enzyme S subunit